MCAGAAGDAEDSCHDGKGQAFVALPPNFGYNRAVTKVITYGSFDLFHEGHYNILKRAKELGDYLIVGVTTEQFDAERGKLNVVDSLVDRIENVRRTGFADLIIVEDHVGQKIEDIQKHGVGIFAIGSDWEGKFDYIGDFCKVVYLPRTKNVSSSLRRSNDFPLIRIGVVGCGRIASRFMVEEKFVSGVSVNCVYNPRAESAALFARTHRLDPYSDFDAFLEQVDAVYVASPHETHYGYAKRCLARKKHVLCEKPLAFAESQAKELFDLSARNGVILLEGIKTAYCPGFTQLVAIARSGAIGAVRDVEACFTRLASGPVRELTDREFGGSFTEYGSYVMLPVVKLLGKDVRDVRFESISAENGIDLYTKAQFSYDKAFSLGKTGLGVKSEGQLVIAGTKGYILAPSPWWLTKEFEVRYEDPNKIEKYATRYFGSGLRYELADFVHIINYGDDRTFKLSAGESIFLAAMMERFMETRRKGHGE